MAEMTSAMSKPNTQYEIRFHHRDATLTMVMMISAMSDDEARAKARRMLKGEVRNANIWRAGRFVDSFSTLRKDVSTRSSGRPARMKTGLGRRRQRQAVNFS